MAQCNHKALRSERERQKNRSGPCDVRGSQPVFAAVKTEEQRAAKD